MSAAQVVGTPPAGGAEVPPVAAEGPVDIVSDARAEARKVLFEGVEPETEGEAPKPVEAKPEPAKEEPKDELALSKEWARISAQEKRLKARQKEFLEKQAAFEEAQKAHEERTKFDNDPIAYLERQGWSKDKIVEWIKGDGKVDPEILVKQLSERHQKEMEELRAERAREREQLEDARRERQKHELEGKLGEVTLGLVGSDPELATLKQYVEGSPQKRGDFIKRRVGEVIRQVWEKTNAQGKPEVVDPRDALVYLQGELLELQLNPGQAPAVKPANPGAVEPRPITNQATSQRVVQSPKYDEMDPAARRARADAYLRGELEDEDV